MMAVSGSYRAEERGSGRLTNRLRALLYYGAGPFNNTRGRGGAAYWSFRRMLNT